VAQLRCRFLCINPAIARGEWMSAYVISEVEVRDAAGFGAYRTIAAKAIARYGGRYLVRGGAASVIWPAAGDHHRR
jgi:uncharacterized protein (DUF1330 family)